MIMSWWINLLLWLMIYCLYHLFESLVKFFAHVCMVSVHGYKISDFFSFSCASVYKINK